MGGVPVGEVVWIDADLRTYVGCRQGCALGKARSATDGDDQGKLTGHHQRTYDAVKL